MLRIGAGLASPAAGSGRIGEPNQRVVRTPGGWLRELRWFPVGVDHGGFCSGGLFQSVSIIGSSRSGVKSLVAVFSVEESRVWRALECDPDHIRLIPQSVKGAKSE
jgi:hypothetical protein